MKVKRRFFIFSVILLSVLAGCEKGGSKLPPDTRNQVTISQGVWGNVWFWEGNFQPTEPTGTVTAAERQVLIYEATQGDSVSFAGGGFYREIRTKLIGTTSSNKTGFFQLALPPGEYSAFVKEDSLYWQGTGNSIGIGGFTVLSGSITKVQIDINYHAGY